MTMTFVHDPLPGKVVFGDGALARLGDEIKALGCSRALVLATPQQVSEAEAVASLLGNLCVGVHAGAVMHVPVECAREGVDAVKRRQADCTVAFGGGSTIGLAKAIALETELPIVAVPTTYAGSEMTPIWGLTADGLKKTGRDRRVLPRVVIYDPSLLLSLPPQVTGPSGMNAIAHCVEALYAPDGNPIISLMAEEGIRAISGALVRAVEAPQDLAARSQTLYGAWLAGACLGAASVSIHHKLCHTLGGTFNLPHAELHTIIIPYATAFNAAAAPEAIGRVARAMGVASGKEAAGALYDLAVAIGAKVRLADIGLKAGDLDKAAELAVLNPYANPRPVDYAGVRQLLEDAYHGRRP